MHCPMCGQELRSLDRTEDLTLNQKDYDAWVEGGYEGPPPGQNPDRSEHLACTNVGCDLRGTYWNLHPGPQGESFALTSTREGRGGGGAYEGRGDIDVSLKKIVHCVGCGNLVRQSRGLCPLWTKKATATCNHCSRTFLLSQVGDSVGVSGASLGP